MSLGTYHYTTAPAGSLVWVWVLTITPQHQLDHWYECEYLPLHHSISWITGVSVSTYHYTTASAGSLVWVLTITPQAQHHCTNGDVITFMLTSLYFAMEVTWKTEWGVVVCLFMYLVGFHWALGSAYILLTLLFLYCALRAHLRGECLINYALFYITLRHRFICFSNLWCWCVH